MALTSGTKLGPYEIQSPLGTGGMGEVYRARDNRLDRSVAIKILPTHLAEDQEARQRFEREARTISSLNHPNICVLHDVGTQDGTAYLVMEYVQGESLDSRLRKGPLPLKQALELAIQICDALDRAHRAGIVHRDLKPGNIMVTESGAKLLDFGLAKPSAAFAAVAGENPGHLTPSTPTVNLSSLRSPAAPLTQQGTIVGTFQYMPPEVVQGGESDARSDIFSFGCVLYEMITGRKAFEGKSQLSVLSAILEKDPEPIATVQPTSPPALDYLITTCLAKNPEDRFQSAHDVRVQLAWLGRAGASASAGPTEQKRTNSWKLFATAVIAVALAVTLSFLWRTQPAPRVMRTSLLPPEGTRFAPLYRNGAPALSPDGTRVAFIASREGKFSLWVRSLDKLEANELQGTEGAYFPFWSPDGRSLGFFARGKLWRMDANGGSLVAICNAIEGRGASWGKWNEILFDGDGSTMSRISAEGGTPVAATSTIFTPSVAMSDRGHTFCPTANISCICIRLPDLATIVTRSVLLR